MQYQKVAAIVPVGEGDVASLPRAIADVRAQRGVVVEPVLVDLTRRGELEGRESEFGAAILCDDSPSRGRALHSALAATSADVLLLVDPRARYDTEHALRLVRPFAADPSVRAVTSDLRVVRDGHAEYVAVDLAGTTPPPRWQAGAAFHRELLQGVDTRAFAPSELALLQRARTEGSARHVARATATLDATDCDAQAATAALDAELLRFAEQTPLERPEVTVLLATHQRCEILMDCLAGFARQLVRPGTIEIVVVDDASTDGTPELLDALELAVPLRAFRLPQPSGAATARNAGMPHATGRLVLFVNDDTIPSPDLVQRHLAAHRDLGAHAMVLGTFRQPDAILDNALNRVLDESHLVFGYADFVPGQELPGSHFYTCNASVAVEAVRAVGAFEAGYALCGGEDTDIGLRLVASGQRLFYRPECRAEHRHRLSLADFERRQRVVARAHVRLYRDHPQLVAGQPIAELTVAELAKRRSKAAPFVEPCRSGARELSVLDLGRIESSGPLGAVLAERLAADLSECVRRLHSVHWTDGLMDGFEQFGIDSFPELLGNAPRSGSSVAENSHA